MKVTDLDLAPPLRVVVPAGTTRVISFPNEFMGSAVALQLQNEDGANAATYRYGGESQPLKNLPPGATRDVSAAIVNLLEVNAGAAGVTVVEFQIVLDPRTKLAPEVKTL